MRYDSIFILVILYFFIFVFYLFYTLSKARCEKQLSFITLVRAMWTLIYGVVPLLVHWHIYTVGKDVPKFFSFDYSPNGIKQFYAAAFFSVIGFLGLNIGYRLRFSKAESVNQISVNEVDKRSDYSDTCLIFSAFIMFFVGLASLIIWTSAYGGIRAVLKYASDLRSGNDIGISNPYTVFKRFAPLLQFANVIYFALWKKRKSFICFGMFCVSLVFSVYYLLANDGRAPTVVHFVALFWVAVSLKTKNSKRKKKFNYFIICFGVLVALFLMHNYESIYNYIAEGEQPELSFDIFATIRDEFSFTVRDIQAAFLALEDNPFMFKLPSEILNGIFGILPSSMRPSWLVNLEVFNTSYCGKGTTYTYYGGTPPDIISTGIYTMNYFGVFLLPALYGILLKKIDEYFKRNKGVFSKILFASLLYPAVRTVAYTNFNGLTLNVFYIFLGCLIIWFVNWFINSLSRSANRQAKVNEYE